MLIPLEYLIQKYRIQFRGILHIGAHECEELADYEKIVSRNDVLWIEAMPHKVELCKRKYDNLRIENAVVSDVVEKVIFNVSNNGQSSSLFEFGLHEKFHPDIHFVNKVECETQLLQNILDKHSDNVYNFINLDIQGAELKALKGAGNYLTNVDYIYTEVNCDYVYKNCALIGEIDAYLQNYGFIRVETKWYGDCKWGDAFYIKKVFSIPHTITTDINGRLCNQIIRNLCVSFIASKNDIYVNYSQYNTIKKLGIDLHIGNKIYGTEVIVNDDNYFDILSKSELNSNVNLNSNYFQTTEIINYIYKYLTSIQHDIINNNPFLYRYNKNNDCAMHIRLTDAERHSLSYDVFDNMLNQIQYNNLFIATDDPNHIIIQKLVKNKGANIIGLDEIKTIQFASTCKHVVLSGGTYSAMIGYLAFYSNVYYSKLSKQNIWHGDIFSIPGWTELS